MKKIYLAPTSTIYKVNGEAIMIEGGGASNPREAESKGMTGDDGPTGPHIDWEIDDDEEEED